jgi:ADP-ribose pyrophosphatase YjhB (NUDIX family)
MTTPQISSLGDLGIALNQPLYVYQKQMFSLTVSVVLVVENGVFLLKEEGTHKISEDNIKEFDIYRCPGGDVMATQESIQFAAVRHVKEQTGIMLKKDALIPVDFRSDPERTPYKNVVDIGFVCILHDILASSYSHGKIDVRWEEVDFENKCLTHAWEFHTWGFYLDHDILLERAIDVVGMMKE